MPRSSLARGLSSNGAENLVKASSLLDMVSILLKILGIWTDEMQLSPVFHGDCETEPTPKAPPWGQWEQRVIFM